MNEKEIKVFCEKFSIAFDTVINFAKEIRKETAKEILQTIWEELGIDILSQCYSIPIRTFNKLKRQFGVEVAEE